jgi:DNA-binding transcriptional LysR family regulator
MILAHIEIRKLRHVAALARTESFIRAADELNLTQSALTRSIQSIEAQLGVRLFDRDRSGVHLTAVGREFLKRAQSILIETDDLARIMTRMGKGEIGKISFGLSALPAKLYLRPIVLDLLQSKAELHCSIAVRDPDELLELLESDKIEFFLGSHVPLTRDASLEVTELAEIRTTCMVRLGHPLLKRSSVANKDLRPYPILLSLFEPGARAPNTFMQEHPLIVSSDDYSAMMQITVESDAILLTSNLPNSELRLHPELVPLTMKTPIETERMTLKSAKLARRTLSPLAQEILDDLTSRCSAGTDPVKLAVT